MKKLLSLLLFSAVLSQAHSQTVIGRQLVDQYPRTASGILTYGLTWLPQTYANTTRTYPLIIFLHGAGETGTTVASLNNLCNTGIPQRIRDGWNATAVNPRTNLSDSFIVVSPQAAGWSYNYESVKYILPNIISRYRVDTTRIYITGLSAGGAGVFTCLGSGDTAFIKKFAAAATACSAGVNSVNGLTEAQVEANFKYASKNYGVRVWTCTGENNYLLDADVRYHDSTNKLFPTPMNKLTVISGVGHSSWNNLYNPSFRPVINSYTHNANCTNGCASIVAPNNNGSPVMGSGVTQDSLNVFEWFLSFQRPVANNTSPTANAGPDQGIILPLANVTLTGSGTAGTGFTISSYAWTKQSGPSSFTITSPSSATTTVTGLVAGTYVFRLTVTNSAGATATDDVQITVSPVVNIPPVANAGSNQVIAWPISIATLSGSGTDADGTVTGYSWSKVSGPASGLISTPLLPITLVTGLTPGVYVYQLTVTDNGGATHSANVQVSVNATTSHIPPTVTASANQTINLPTSSVNVSSTNTVEGSIATTRWSKFKVPGQTTKKVVVLGSSTSLGTGTTHIDSSYVGRLRNYYTNNGIVTTVVNLANSGADIGSALPTGTTPMSGFSNPDPLRNVTAALGYGPDVVIVNFPSNGYTNPLVTPTIVAQQTQVIYDALAAAGVKCYITTTQSREDFSMADRLKLQVIRDTLLNRFGANCINFYNGLTTPGQTTQLPEYAAGDGIHFNNLGHERLFQLVRAANIFQTSITSASAITNPTAAATSITGLAAGTHQFQVSVIDANGLAASAITQVVVTGTANVPPVANAGTNQTIQLPVSQVTLNGSASNDPDGTITTYAWTKSSGPSAGTITTPAAAITTVTGLVAGTYVFRLTVTDNNGATHSATVQVIVTAAANVPPVANAGTNQTIQLPVSQVTLNGSASNDPDGTITTYAWTKTSGPSAGTITTPAAVSTTVTGLVAGTYVYRLTVTDNNGATHSATVQITVNAAAANVPPIANAGPNQTIQLPVNQASLSGSASNDPDGTITTYAWTKTSGPSAGTITTPAAVGTTVTGLVVGTYVFRLTVTDNIGATHSANVQVTVNAASAGACTGNKYVITPYPADHGYYTVGGFNPGDTILLNDSGTYFENVVFVDLHGTASCPIVIMNDPALGRAVRLRGRTAQLALGNCTDVKVTGSGIPSVQYGIDLDAAPGAWTLSTWGDTYFSFVTSGRSRKVEWERVATRHGGVGFEIKQDGDCDPAYNFPNWVMDSIVVHDSKIIGAANQGMYIGNTSPDNGPDSYDVRPVDCNGVITYPRPIRVGYIHVYNMYIDSTGRGGIQLSGGDGSPMDIHHNIVKHAGLNGDEQQGSAISWGTYTWPYVHDNVISNTYTWPIASQGGGYTSHPIRIENNIIDSAGYLNTYNPDLTIKQNTLLWPLAIYFATKPMDSLPALDSTQFHIKNNRIGLEKNIDHYSIALDDWEVMMQRWGNIICGNTKLDGVTPVNVYNNGSATAIPYSTNCSGGPNQLPVANAGANQTITLPVNTVTVVGSGTDPDGTIMSYQWRKISGPSQYNIASATSATTIINNLVQGTYQFELRVIDNLGGLDLDTMSVIVNPGNIPPVANAGPNQSIILPLNSVTINGSGTDADGIVMFYQWSKIAGPSQFTIASPTSGNTVIGNLVQGVYQFELRVTDNLGASGNDTVIITVSTVPPANAAPTANAGNNQTITLPVNTVTLTGSGTDPDGTITGYQWNKIAGPSQFTIVTATSAQTVVNNLAQGTYQFELVVTDNQGATGKDTVWITVNPASAPANVAPTANAGNNQTITLPVNTVTLTGSGTDPDGTITGYQWNKIAGPSQFTIVTATSAQTVVNNLAQGIYQFELVVTDNQGATGKDTVWITVNPASAPANVAPTANAGNNQTITLPVNTVTLTGSGTDPDGTITGYQWNKIAGPAQFTIVSATSAQTAVNSLVQGTYQFELVVTDNQGATGKDTVWITVNPASAPANVAPTANAGNNQTITLPVNTVTLTGSGTDPDGTITGFQWNKIAGPSQFTIVTATSAQTVVNNLAQGIYQFELVVTDNQGATGKDTVWITVNPASAPANIAPVASAGANIVITLPVNTVTLTGSGTDPDGTITGYQWNKIAGPSQFTIVAATSAQTVVNNLAQGIYQFELTVTDNQGATGKATITVTVNPAVTPPPPNQAPVANAGLNINITLPTNSVNLTGLGTDVDGTVVAYHWTMIDGSSFYNIGSPNSANSSITGLIEGFYKFELRVTDDDGAVGRDTVAITVHPAIANVAVFPNPATTFVKLQIDAKTPAGTTNIQILDGRGRVVYKESFVRSQQSVTKEVDITRFPRGAYFVVVDVDGNRIKLPSLIIH